MICFVDGYPCGLYLCHWLENNDERISDNFFLVDDSRLLIRLRWNETHFDVWFGLKCGLDKCIACTSSFLIIPINNPLTYHHITQQQIWVRNYQILEQSTTTAKEAHNQRKLTGQSSSTSLIEIGPRFVLNPIRIFRGSFGGQTLYVNEQFVNPNVVRSMEKKEQGERYVKRKGAEKKRQRYGEELKRHMPVDPLGDVFK